MQSIYFLLSNLIYFRTQKTIVHHEKSRDKSNHIYLAQLYMVIAQEISTPSFASV